jgi:hypothetical protein
MDITTYNNFYMEKSKESETTYKKKTNKIIHDEVGSKRSQFTTNMRYFLFVESSLKLLLLYYIFFYLQIGKKT